MNRIPQLLNVSFNVPSINVMDEHNQLWSFGFDDQHTSLPFRQMKSLIAKKFTALEIKFYYVRQTSDQGTPYPLVHLHRFVVSVRQQPTGPFDSKVFARVRTAAVQRLLLELQAVVRRECPDIHSIDVQAARLQDPTGATIHDYTIAELTGPLTIVRR